MGLLNCMYICYDMGEIIQIKVTLTAAQGVGQVDEGISGSQWMHSFCRMVSAPEKAGGPEPSPPAQQVFVEIGYKQAACGQREQKQNNVSAQRIGTVDECFFASQSRYLIRGWFRSNARRTDTGRSACRPHTSGRAQTPVFAGPSPDTGPTSCRCCCS